MNRWDKEARDLLDFWVRYSPDTLRGGFYGRMDGQGVLHADAPKGLVLHARILWTFSAAWEVYRETAYLDMAHAAYAYLIDRFYDPVYGGAYWSVQAGGQPLEMDKQTYGQAFFLYGLTEYYRVSARQDVLQKAKDLFHCIEVRTKDSLHGGYFEAFSRSWAVEKDVRISGGEAKSTNTHLHILEAFTALYRIWPDFSVRRALEQVYVLFEEKIYEKGRGMHSFFATDWTPVDAPLSFGHDIETYWLLQEAAAALGSDSPKIYAQEMPERALAHLDEDGAMWNDELRREKHWWVQAEALAGFAYAYQSTGEERYKGAILQVWDAVENRFKCPDGEWYWGVDNRGEIVEKEDRMGFWKCPYHHVRALLILSKMEVLTS